MISLDDLKCYSLFGGIMDDDLALIRSLLHSASFSTGVELMHEGDHGDRLYFILEGQVEILITDTEAPALHLKRIAILGPGETVGEMELIDIQPRAATVRALTPVSTVCLSTKDFFTIKKSHLETFTVIVMNLARDISRRLRHMDKEVVRERHQRESERIARTES